MLWQKQPDDQFRLTLYEFMNGGTTNFDPDRLAQLKFNPLLCAL